MQASDDVFVAYAGPDRDLATALVVMLHARGVTARWDGHLHAEESFTSGIGALIARCWTFVVLVSQHTWDGQHYATDELAQAITLARRDEITIVPIWIETIAPEDRPYGIVTLTGISLPDHAGCLGCVAGLIHEAVLRRKLAEVHRELSARITAAPLPEITRPSRDGERGVKPETVSGLDAARRLPDTRSAAGH